MASFRPSHIAQIAIPVDDLDRAKHFYGAQLGLDHLFDAPPGLAFFQCGETRLMLGPSDRSLVYYQVEDLAAAHAALTSAGTAFEADPHFVARLGDRDLWLAVCRDSEGNLVGLMSYR